MTKNQIVLVGASVRAAAMSARRAGLVPVCVDLFADRDARRIADCHIIARNDYPAGIGRVMRELQAAPWCYTGRLENHSQLIEDWSLGRPLIGCGAEVVRRVRDPVKLSRDLCANGVDTPEVRCSGQIDANWLIKPLYGSGTHAIRVAGAIEIPPNFFAQRRVEGTAVSGAFVGRKPHSVFLGATRQLVGEPWLHAADWSYCGSIGPIELSASAKLAWRRIGETLVGQFGCEGPFGVDAIMVGDAPWVIEVNPRYTASMEILELANQCSVMKSSIAEEPLDLLPMPLGKAVFFGPHTVEFPIIGAWDEDLAGDFEPWRVPRFADIPPPGAIMHAGEPVMTMLERGASVSEVERRLIARAYELSLMLCSQLASNPDR